MIMGASQFRIPPSRPDCALIARDKRVVQGAANPTRTPRSGKVQATDISQYLGAVGVSW